MTAKDPLPAVDTSTATDVLRQRFSIDDEPGRSARRRRGQPDNELPVAKVAANPRNTRDVTARPIKIKKLAKSIKSLGQLQECPVVTREAYFALFPPEEFPEDAKAIGDAPYVLVPGGRRRAAIVYAGLPTIRVDYRDDLAESREKFLEATFAENDDREPLDPIEEALALQQLVAEAPSVAAVARKRRRSDAYVFQMLNLLKLEKEVQEALCVDDDDPEDADPEDLTEGETPPRRRRLPIREPRIGNWHELSREDQLAKLAAWRRHNDPSFAENSAPKQREPKAKVSRIRAALLKLGKTPQEMAKAIRAELSDEERIALANELLLEDAAEPVPS